MLEKSWPGVEDKLPAEVRKSTEALGRTEPRCIRKGSGVGIVLQSHGSAGTPFLSCKAAERSGI